MARRAPSVRGVVRWRRKKRLPNGAIYLTSLDDAAERSLTAIHACDVVSCYVDPVKLCQLAAMRGTSVESAFRSYLPTKAHLKSGDFGEMLMWRLLQERGDRPRIPLMRWQTRQSRDDTVRGTDLIGYVAADSKPSKDDVLVLCEVKTRSSTKKATIVREAFNGVKKSYVTRLADQLFFQQHNLISLGDPASAQALNRFANPHAFGDYKTRLTAAVVHDSALWDDVCLDEMPSTGRLKAEVEVLVVCADALRQWIADVRRAATRHARTLNPPTA
jgi:hypothetical protein